jgi:hypothetical protein
MVNNSLGLGEYLAEIDSSRTWQEHLEHIIILCQVHCQRNFMARYPNHEALYRIKQLWNLDNPSAIIQQLTELCSTYPELETWLDHKMNPWILAGLCDSISKIPFSYRQLANKNTNLSESSHHRDNIIGRGLTLLAAVLR